MIVRWFTQPPKRGFSSYYQYDTVSKNLVRIRLELGRKPHVTSSGAVHDDGLPAIVFDKNRIVGFSKSTTTELKAIYAPRMKEGFGTRLSFEDGRFRFEIRDGVQLLVNEITVPDNTNKESWSRPGEFVYDTTLGSGASHTGNWVTTNKILPEGINLNHLTLLANNAIIKDQRLVSFPVGPGTDAATANRLSEMIVNEAHNIVTDLLSLPRGTEISDKEILAALKRQDDIEIANLKSSELVAARGDVFKVEKDVAETMVDGGVVPDQTLESLGANLQASASRADFKSMASDAAAMNGYLTTAVQRGELADSAAIRAVRAALSNVETSATAFRAAEESHQSLEAADSVEAYEADIGVDRNVGFEPTTKIIK